jgi:hypothetical protein
MQFLLVTKVKTDILAPTYPLNHPTIYTQTFVRARERASCGQSYNMRILPPNIHIFV